jgi:hypothetical protein
MKIKIFASLSITILLMLILISSVSTAFTITNKQNEKSNDLPGEIHFQVYDVFTDLEPIKGITVYVKSHDGEINRYGKTNYRGNCCIDNLPVDQEYIIGITSIWWQDFESTTTLTTEKPVSYTTWGTKFQFSRNVHFISEFDNILELIRGTVLSKSLR